jgi:hypothetical protein
MNFRNEAECLVRLIYPLLEESFRYRFIVDEVEKNLKRIYESGRAEGWEEGVIYGHHSEYTV